MPRTLRELKDPQRDLPRIAKDADLTAAIEAAVRRVPTKHEVHLQDARNFADARPNSVHLVLTSPPYWTLKRYRDHPGQLGHMADYEAFLTGLDTVWKRCFDLLAPGGRLICVVGDVCLSRRSSGRRHQVVPLHAAVQEHCRALGFDNLAPIIWHKIAKVAYEVDRGGGFLGKPFEPNAILKNDVEFILMLRKPGGYRAPSTAARVLSVISVENHRKWFQQIWTGITGASTRKHPAPFPLTLAERLIRMFSFVGDTVLDPFLGTGSTTVAAARWGRNSIGVEVDPEYFGFATQRLARDTGDLFSSASVQCFDHQER